MCRSAQKVRLYLNAYKQDGSIAFWRLSIPGKRKK